MKDLLLLHGALGSKEQFAELERLLSNQFRVHTLSFSGHGRRPSHHHAFTIQNFAHEVLDWLNEHYTNTVDIFGYSMGGYVALWLARFYPQRVGRIFTLGTKLKWNEEEVEKELKMLVPESLVEKVPAFAQALADRHGEHEWKSVMSKTGLLMKDLAHTHLTDVDFAELEARIQLGLGTKDNMVTKEETQHVASLLKAGNAKFFDAVPHAIEKVPLELLRKEIISFFQ